MTSSTPGLEVLHEIASALENDGPITIGTMFRSPGIRTGDKIVAFLGHDGGLIVKLPRARASELLEAGAVEPVTMGTRTMREWVVVPAGDDIEATLTTWLPLAKESLVYVRATATKPARTRGR
ncbi:hypothetical protein [Agromyces ramosus]|uniref:TfoX/Sxy family transcriptional regulator of competence genes n=1 Tax=Agromyces ramosus TaxID=33879 RepID=A0ABU0RE63_9MICO|nr:hypothetical protein [Agromyces ramosus]MDQ0896062.1 TfoX/Sxy family transcriptional regulator of competence genes [Agromyces ramosus]